MHLCVQVAPRWLAKLAALSASGSLARGELRGGRKEPRHPAAPARGDTPVNIPPRLSPNHQTASAQTIEAASADLRVRGTRIPTAMSSWIVAKSALYSTMCRSISSLAQVTELAMKAGLPAVLGSMT